MTIRFPNIPFRCDSVGKHIVVVPKQHQSNGDMKMKRNKSNLGKIQRLVAVGVVILVAGQSASAEVIKKTVERHADIWVECLDDFIYLDWVANNVITTHENGNIWMYTQNSRQSGSAVDSYGNSWNFRGHFQASEHADLRTEGYTTKFHLISHDVLIGGPDGPGNLLMKTSWRIVWENGAPQIDLRETTVSCLP